MVDKMILLLVLQLAMAAALFWSCFCRLVKTDEETVREIRWVIVFEGLAAMLVFGAPFFPLVYEWAQWPAFTTPNEIWLVLLAAAAFIQIATARYWEHGQPDHFKR